MYLIEVTYDTGDSFHQEHDVKHIVKELKWKSLTKAKKALKDIVNHYKFYMTMHKEWSAGKKEKDKAQRIAKSSKWYDERYPDFNIHVENDDGERINISSCWTGYFDSMVGADIITEEDDGMSFRFKKY